MGYLGRCLKSFLPRGSRRLSAQGSTKLSRTDISEATHHQSSLCSPCSFKSGSGLNVWRTQRLLICPILLARNYTNSLSNCFTFFRSALFPPIALPTVHFFRQALQRDSGCASPSENVLSCVVACQRSTNYQPEECFFAISESAPTSKPRSK